jgi:hypothetical protein
MYKDKEVKKNVKDIFFINVWRKDIFDIYVTEYGTALTTIFLTKGKSKLIIIQTEKISQQPENCENRNDPDLVRAFLKKWWGGV